jgi:1-acyl-sn-glycerol-3-phosphate acyltransferase
MIACSRLAALLALAGLFLPLALATRLFAGIGARATALRLAAEVQRRWARAVLAVIGVDVRQEGAWPAGPCLVVANHLSYLDIPVLAALCPGRFIAKREIAAWPVLGQMAAAVGTIWVDQGRRRDVLRVDDEMVATFAAGVPVLLFPEGRSTRGERVERLHSSLLECAVRAELPCLAVALTYETPEDRWAPASTVCWWGGMGFWRHALGLLGLRRIVARVSLAPSPRRGRERKALAAELQADLERGFQPVRQEPVAPDCPWRGLLEGDARGKVLSAEEPPGLRGAG